MPGEKFNTLNNVLKIMDKLFSVLQLVNYRDGSFNPFEK